MQDRLAERMGSWSRPDLWPPRVLLRCCLDARGGATRRESAGLDDKIPIVANLNAEVAARTAQLLSLGAATVTLVEDR